MDQIRLIGVVVVLSSLFLQCSAQVLCTNPLVIGELRIKKSRQCVDIDGKDGAGNVQTHECEGDDDQQIILCGDGTIRNEARNYCFTPRGSGNDNVESSACQHYPRIPARQKWRLGRSKKFYDMGGILQEAREIINVESNRCLDVSGYDGTGNIGVYHCENKDDQYFYFRSRGKEVAFGRLRNEKSSQCLDVSGYDGKGNVQMYDCEDKKDQWFKFYENGEVVNEQSRRCLDVSGYDGTGNIGTYCCEDKHDQMWSRPSQLCNGESCSFVNKKSGQCLDVSGYDGRGGVATYHCEGLADQRLKWVTDKWTAPNAVWVMVGCNQNGKVSQWLSNTVSYSSTITHTVTVEVGASMEADLVFAKATVSTKVSTSLSTAWTKSQSGTTRIVFTCEYYDNQEAFTGGCMWQLRVDTKHVNSGRLLTWSPQITRCTTSNTQPRCPPFTKCVDKACSLCQEI
uniref:Chrysaoralin n=1 Tax=Chrysaora quinquecirrha TaxID=6148 RepID=A0A1C9FQM5_CHRQI|nr:chrysaoralin [Chrysaora quinquecirrha]